MGTLMKMNFICIENSAEKPPAMGTRLRLGGCMGGMQRAPQ